MKSSSPTLRGYRPALRQHLDNDPALAPDAAACLGVRAAKNGLGPSDLVRIHEASVIALASEAPGRDAAKTTRRAKRFLAMAMAALEPPAVKPSGSEAKLKATIGSLRQRAGELATRNAELRAEIRHHRSVEAGLKAAEIRSGRLLQESRREQESLRLLSRKLLSAQEDERKRISRDLHDVIAQALTGINLRLAGINLQTTADAKKLLRKIAIAQKLLEKSMDAVHRFAVNLRPSVLDDLGLIPALRSHLRHFSDECGIIVNFTATTAVEQLDSASRTALYRIVQEAMVNIARHSGARRAIVRISGHQRSIRLEVIDNGKGFRTGKPATAGGLPRLGLLGMKERVEMVGGTFQIHSKPGKGTTIQVEIPRPADPAHPNQASHPTRHP